MKLTTKKIQIIFGILLIIGGIALTIYGFHFFGTFKYKVGRFIHSPKINQVYIPIVTGIATAIIGAILVFFGQKKKQ